MAEYHSPECMCIDCNDGDFIDKSEQFDFDMWTQELDPWTRIAWFALEARIAEAKQ